MLIGIGFGTLLTLSALNDYLFFEWLSMATFIILALIGFHFIGQQQTKRS